MDKTDGGIRRVCPVAGDNRRGYKTVAIFAEERYSIATINGGRHGEGNFRKNAPPGAILVKK
jgi:hypothetical protein